MSHRLAVTGLLLLLALAPAADAVDASGPDGAAPAAAEPLHHRTLDIVSGTAIGGDPDRAATRIATKAQMRRFAKSNDVTELRSDLVKAFAKAGAKQTVWAAVVSLGCDVPPAVKVRGTVQQVYLDPVPAKDPKPECFAPVTSVAVVGVR